MAITSVGVGSGLELESLIKDILRAESEPVEKRLAIKETTVQASITAYNNLKSTLTSFQNTLGNLKQTSFVGKQTATAGDNTLFQATTTSAAQNGNYAIDVFEMAKAHKVASTANFTNGGDKVGAGTLSFSSGSSNFNVTVSETDSLTKIRDAVNSASGNNSISASLLTVDAGQNDGSTVTRLVFSAKNTGAANAITITANDNDGNNGDNTGLSRLASVNLNELTAAQDARIAIDGYSVKSATNTFANAIDGVSIQIFKESSEQPDPVSSTLTLSNDKNSVKKEIEKFVATYNELTTVLNTLTNYNSTTQTSGLLSGDSTVTLLENQLRRTMSSVNSDASSDMNSLAFLGISTNRDGTIALDSNKLTDAIDNKFDKISGLFTGENGIASKLDKQLSKVLGSDGAINSRQASFQDQIKEIDKTRETLELRLEKLETRYRAQFSYLDTLVAQLSQTGTFLSQQFDAAAAMVSGKK